MIQRTRDRRGPGLARRWGRASENDNPAGKAAFGRGPTCPGGTTRCCALTPWLQATGSHPTARNHDQCGDQNRGCPACEDQGRSCHQRPVPVARHSAHLRNAVGRTGCVARPTAHRFNRMGWEASRPSTTTATTIWRRRPRPSPDGSRTCSASPAATWRTFKEGTRSAGLCETRWNKAPIGF